jgi:hypothetical protein
MSGLMEATEAMWTGTRDSSDKQAWELTIRRGMQQAVRLSDKITDRKTLGVWQIKTRFAHAKVVVGGGSEEDLSYPIFMPKLSTHRVHDPRSIVPHIRPKVFTDNQMPRITYNYHYINSVSKGYDDSQRNEIAEVFITP